MTDFLKNWTVQSEANAKLFAQELLITQVTEEIWRIMEESEVNKIELAKKMNDTETNISELLDNSANITLQTLSDICFALGCRPAFRLEIL